MPHLLLAAAVPSGGEGSGSLTLLVVYVTIAIGVSFLCSIMEAVLLSVSPAYIGALEADKPTWRPAFASSRAMSIDRWPRSSP